MVLHIIIPPYGGGVVLSVQCEVPPQCSIGGKYQEERLFSVHSSLIELFYHIICLCAEGSSLSLSSVSTEVSSNVSKKCKRNNVERTSTNTSREGTLLDLSSKMIGNVANYLLCGQVYSLHEHWFCVVSRRDKIWAVFIQYSYV